jgi:hypothetical protein
MQIAGIGHLAPHRFGQLDSLQRIADLRQAVDPDRIVEVAQRRHRLLALPFRDEVDGIVHDVAQAQHQMRAALLQHLQGLVDLAAQAERLLVDDEDVGVEDVGGVLDDGIPHRQGLVDVDQQAQGRVVARAQLDHPRDADEVDPGPEVKTADDRRAGQDNDRHVLVLVDQGMGNGAAAAQVAEAERVVAVDEDAGVPLYLGLVPIGLVQVSRVHPPTPRTGFQVCDSRGAEYCTAVLTGKSQVSRQGSRDKSLIALGNDRAGTARSRSYRLRLGAAAYCR